MNQQTKSLLKEWGIPLIIILVLYFTGWYRPVISFAQRMVLSTGVIKPDTEFEENGNYQITDYSWTLQTLEGTPVPFESFRGKVVFLNFFATWCPPCIAEMPGIQDLYESTNNDDIAFIILSRDESRAKAAQFMDKKGYTLPVYMAAGPTPPEFQSQVIPTTFIISRQGEIVSRHSGMADYDNEKVRGFLRELTERL
jgi:thiol-disulfide isomerase/thioredoxin